MGGCIDDNNFVTEDDLVSFYYQYADIDRLCPLSSEFGCDDVQSDLCLGEDVSETLSKNGGMAQGAKLAVFDAFYGDFGLMTLVGNDLWEPCAEADCKLHSNSWGGDYECQLGSNDLLYDEFMYKVRRLCRVNKLSLLYCSVYLEASGVFVVPAVVQREPLAEVCLPFSRTTSLFAYACLSMRCLMFLSLASSN